MARLYISSLKTSPLVLDKDQTHYLKNVLRLRVNDSFHVFNETGEWEANILDLKKGSCLIALGQQMRTPTPLPSVGLAFAPLKHDAQSFLLEKATELGVTDLYPVITQRSNIHRIQSDKWLKNTIEACQQCERLSPPHLHALQPLPQFLASLTDNIQLLVAKERGPASAISDLLTNLSSEKIPIFLIGPEGGFTDEEFQLLHHQSQCNFLTLGPRILRAETAALAVLSCFQALIGDWQV
jgi:16S rRNA (uracil1498-N3)-methyltransferase